MHAELHFRRAEDRDVGQIVKILRAAAERMLAEGKRQWTEHYPGREHVIADIRRDNGYVLEADGRIAAYGAVVFDGEPAYSELKGKWLSDSGYVVVHRLAVSSDIQRQGVAATFFNEVEKLAVSKGIGSFKVDTNFDNERMLTFLKKSGFTYCGEVSYESGSRKAFEKLL